MPSTRLSIAKSTHKAIPSSPSQDYYRPRPSRNRTAHLGRSSGWLKQFLPLLLLPPIEWKSYKRGAQNTHADKRTTACGSSGSCLVPLYSLSRLKEQHIQARSHVPPLALSSDNALNTSDSKIKLPFVTTWEAQSPKIKFVLQKRNTGICQRGPSGKCSLCLHSYQASQSSGSSQRGPIGFHNPALFQHQPPE